jgi:hypothetical protein
MLYASREKWGIGGTVKEGKKQEAWKGKNAFRRGRERIATYFRIWRRCVES